ncbi:MATH domain-containing protein At5g43560-like isoform X2 [Asparagus officinalis]|uniref:MATH domain-containing protein At5g43560-like isoform X2 n=1 Tax=Asparagus officinalis TaxID=4686 RepID=UPI00098E1E19|nr:MATH domain-containing protein At5g43560-like isoform X2 [Asparagus officinalis]
MSGSSTAVDFASGGRLSMEDTSSGQRCMSDDSFAELRSCGQVENGTPSTSPPYWGTDDEDNDCGPKPSALFGKFTWKIEKFSQINKRELRSNAFEVGGYKWYILIYPQGCDVCNHLSLFLCVANHDKLLPGWSHFAQFTIAVVNKDPKKSKYSDTLHRFWKKEHDWGWKKFIELSKVYDGFVNEDSLVIKAKVQVIREKAHRPFRCLDCQYRRELVRVYLSNVEQICRRFVEDRKGKFSKLIEDKVRWSSFRAFWLGVDQITRQHMSRQKTDAILKVVVKHFFVEKEVTSTLVMDSLYSGLKALECQSKNQKGQTKPVEMEELSDPVIHIKNDMFVLADDILLLLERVALGPVPLQPLTQKDDKGSQNRTKDTSSGEEFNKDSIEREERRLMEFGRKTLEFFVLAHIFSRIEVAYQEAIAFKRQEELIREEEAAEQAENGVKAKRNATEKEKRSKKKQAKQKRNSRKVKDRARDEKPNRMMQDKLQEQSPSDESFLEEFSSKSKKDLHVSEKFEPQVNAADSSDTGEDVSEAIEPDLENKDCSPISTESSKPVLQNEQTEKRSTCLVDDSSSTCSTDSVPSVVMNGSYKGNSMQNSASQASHTRGKNQQSKETHNQSSKTKNVNSTPGSCRTSGPETEASLSLNIRRRYLEQHGTEKEEVVLQKELNVTDQIDEQPSNSRTSGTSLAPMTPTKKPPYILLHQSKHSSENTLEAVTLKESHSSSSTPSTVSACELSRSRQVCTTSKSSSQQAASISRPSSAPLPPQRQTVPVVSTAQTIPQLSRSVSATGRIGASPSALAPAFVPQSYRNAITGKNDADPIPLCYNHPSLTLESIMGNKYQPRHEEMDIYTSRMPSGMVSDEFPHLDIINDLLDEDKNIAKVAANLHYQQHQYPFDQHYPLSSHNHLDQTEQYYGSSSSIMQHSQMDLSAYSNGQLQGLIQNQWPYNYAADLSTFNLGNASDAQCSYRLPDYMYSRRGNGL